MLSSVTLKLSIANQSHTLCFFQNIAKTRQQHSWHRNVNHTRYWWCSIWTLHVREDSSTWGLGYECGLCITLPRSQPATHISGIYWKLGSMAKQTATGWKEGVDGGRAQQQESTLPPPNSRATKWAAEGRLSRRRKGSDPPVLSVVVVVVYCLKH